MAFISNGGTCGRSVQLGVRTCMYVRILFEASMITQPRVSLAFPSHVSCHLDCISEIWSPPKVPSHFPRMSLARPAHLLCISPHIPSHVLSGTFFYPPGQIHGTSKRGPERAEPVASRASSNTLLIPLESTESYYGNASSYGNSHPHSFDCYASLALQTKRQMSKHSGRLLQFEIRLLLLECHKNISIGQCYMYFDSFWIFH